MSHPHPFSVGETEWERGLWWMVLASGAVHLCALAALLVIAPSFLNHPLPMQSYTVELIAPNKVGGNNMIAGGKGRTSGAPLTAPAKPKPPPPKIEPQPPKAAPPPVPPKVEARPKEPAVAIPVKPRSIPPPAAKPAAAEVEAAAKAAAEKQAEAARRAAAAKQAAEERKAEEARKAAEAKKAEEARKAAEAKKAAEAAKRKAAQAKKAKEAAQARARDERIAAAIKRVEQQVGQRGAGSGTAAGEHPGGPIAVGPGTGAGGKVMGVEYLLYYNQMINRIKQAWVWAGANRALQAVVRFNITASGAILNVRVTQSSGDPTFDVSVERAVRAVNPLPPPPSDYRKQFGDVELTFTPAQLQRQ